MVPPKDQCCNIDLFWCILWLKAMIAGTDLGYLDIAPFCADMAQL